MSMFFPDCPVEGCTTDASCEECTGAVVVALSSALGVTPPPEHRKAAHKKLWRWAGENLEPDPQRPLQFSTEDMTDELGAAIAVEKKPEPAEGES